MIKYQRHERRPQERHFLSVVQIPDRGFQKTKVVWQISWGGLCRTLDCQMSADVKKEEIDLAEESDRGAVIVAAAILEDDLAEILEKLLIANHMPEKHRKEMFDLNGPLSSFSSKMLICYGFGLISKDVFDDLTKIRRLRNRFAHSSEDVDFFAEEIKSIVYSLKCTEFPRK